MAHGIEDKVDASSSDPADGPVRAVLVWLIAVPVSVVIGVPLTLAMLAFARNIDLKDGDYWDSTNR